MSRNAARKGFYPLSATQLISGTTAMEDTAPEELTRVPGLFRLWDLQFVLSPGADYEVSYAESTGDGTPLFAVFKRQSTVRP